MAEVETFLEITWGDAVAARQARDERAAQVQAEGMICTCKDLWTVQGRQVFLLEVNQPEPVEIEPVNKTPKAAGDRAMPRLKGSNRPTRSYETR